MNTKRILEVAALVEQCDEFSMCSYCIADICSNVPYGGDQDTIEVDLGLSCEEAGRLYAPLQPGVNWMVGPNQDGFITKEHAAAVLRHLAATGTVDWSVGVKA